jgi:cytochrome P450
MSDIQEPVAVASAEDGGGLAGLEADELISKFHVFHPDLCDLEKRKLILGKLLRECPVGYSNTYDGYWVITRYADQQHVYKTDEVFSSTIPIVPRLPGTEMLIQIPPGLDGEEHKAYRRVLAGAFTRRRVEDLEPELRRYARALAEEFAATEGPYDFRHEFALKLPAFGFLRIVGLPAEDLDQLVEFNEWILRHQLSDDEAVRERFRTVETPQFVAYIQKQINARRDRATAPDDLLTIMVQATVFDRPISDEELISIMATLIGAGLDTTTAQLGLHMHFFANHQDRWQELIDHPERIPTAIEELLRRNGVVNPGRVVLSDTEVRGQTIRKGELVLTVPPAVAYDEEACDEPEQVDFTREKIRHTTFGGGPHQCIGAGLARFTLEIAYQELLRAVPRFRVAEGTTPRLHVGNLWGIEELELEVR